MNSRTWGHIFVSQCFVVICVGLLLVIALRILVVAFRHRFFWWTGGVTDWEFTYCVLREGMFGCERREYLWVSPSKEIVCCQLQTPCFSENKNTKNSYKIPESVVFWTLLMSGFQIFAADAAFQNRAQRDFFTHPTKRNALSFPDFAQKACGSVVPHDPRSHGRLFRARSI